MKKTLYMIVLLIAAIFFGDLCGKNNIPGLTWLGKSKSIDFDPDTFINTDVLRLKFGIFINFNVCQVIFVLIALLVFYKTAPKLISGK